MAVNGCLDGVDSGAMSWFFSGCDRFALIEVVRGILGSLLRSTTSSSTLASKVRLGVGGNSSYSSAMLSKERSTGVVVSTKLLKNAPLELLFLKCSNKLVLYWLRSIRDPSV